MNANKGLAMLMRPLSKLKSLGQDLYTAEDDFWKIILGQQKKVGWRRRSEN